MAHAQAKRTRPFGAVVGGLCALLALGLAHCGAVGKDAPEPPPAPPAQCRTLENAMPGFFALLRSDGSNLEGLRTVVERMMSGTVESGANPVAELLSATVRGLKNYTKDPAENAHACWSLGELASPTPPPLAPLCSIEAEAGEQCENRMCAVRRALDLGLRDQQAKAALEALRPLLVTVLGYVSNKGPGADGTTHYEAFDFLYTAAGNSSLCSPRNLVDVIDRILVFFRNNPACGNDCPGTVALRNVEALLADPALEQFLADFEESEGGGRGKAGILAVIATVGRAMENMPANEHYFDGIDNAVKLVMQFLGDEPKYAGMKAGLESMLGLLRELLRPDREGSLLLPLKEVMHCVNTLDKDQALTGAVYDLMSRPTGAGGLDVKELVGAIGDVVELDRSGVLAGMLHAVLASLSADPEALDALRRFFVQAQAKDNATLLVPALQDLLIVPAGAEQSPVEELADVLDELVYGCRAERP